MMYYLDYNKILLSTIILIRYNSTQLLAITKQLKNIELNHLRKER